MLAMIAILRRARFGSMTAANVIIDPGADSSASTPITRSSMAPGSWLRKEK